MSKTVCIYHNIDLDGLMSAAIIKHWFITNNKNYTINGTHVAIRGQTTHRIEDDNSLDFIGYNYGQPIPDLSYLTHYDKIILCGVKFPRNIMMYIHNGLYTPYLIWIDNHHSAIKELDTEFISNSTFKYEGIRNIYLGVCELTWNYFNFDEPMPEIVKLIGNYSSNYLGDEEEKEKILKFQYGARTLIQNIDDAYKFLKINLQSHSDIIGSILAEGESVYKYLCLDALEIYKNKSEIYFMEPIFQITESKFYFKKEEEEAKWFAGDNKKFKIDMYERSFICINKKDFNLNHFWIDYYKDDYDGCACFYYSKSRWHFTIYNDNGLVDCSKIAKQFNGYGKKHVAWFTCDKDQFEKIMNNDV